MPVPPLPDPQQVVLDWRTDHLLGEPFQEAPLGPATLVRYPHPDDAPPPDDDEEVTTMTREPLCCDETSDCGSDCC